jgi:hypothetical protein
MTEQTLPMKVDGAVVHKRWTLDLRAAVRASGVDRDRLARDAAEMAEHFSRWVLILVREGQPVPCSSCASMIVFDDGLRCASCAKALKGVPTGAHAGWFGLLPPIGLDGLPTVRDAVLAKPPRRHVVGRRDELGAFILVPLVAMYGPTYPRTPLEVFYLPEFRDIPGIPRDEYSHAFHMIGKGRMCLFAAGDWREELSPRVVLQQRAYPHAIKFLNYANGKQDAFAIVTR